MPRKPAKTDRQGLDQKARGKVLDSIRRLLSVENCPFAAHEACAWWIGLNPTLWYRVRDALAQEQLGRWIGTVKRGMERAAVPGQAAFDFPGFAELPARLMVDDRPLARAALTVPQYRGYLDGEKARLIRLESRDQKKAETLELEERFYRESKRRAHGDMSLTLQQIWQASKTRRAKDAG